MSTTSKVFTICLSTFLLVQLIIPAASEASDGFIRACYDGNFEGVSRILSMREWNKEDVNEGNVLGTPLGVAAQKGHSDIVKYLLDHGADPNIKDNDGDTPLIIVAKTHDWAFDTVAKPYDSDYGKYLQSEIVKLLLSKGADVDAQDEAGLTALSWAIDRHNFSIEEILIKAGANYDSETQTEILISACDQGDLKTVSKMISDGADINKHSKRDGETALMRAASRGRNEIVKLLLSNGAEIDAQAEDGSTALISAVEGRGGRTATVQILVEAGADIYLARQPNLLERSQAQVIDSSDGDDVFAAVGKVQERSIKINSADYSPIAIAARNGATDIVELLLEHEEKKSPKPSKTLKQSEFPDNTTDSKPEVVSVSDSWKLNTKYLAGLGIVLMILGYITFILVNRKK